MIDKKVFFNFLISVFLVLALSFVAFFAGISWEQNSMSAFIDPQIEEECRSNISVARFYFGLNENFKQKDCNELLWLSQHHEKVSLNSIDEKVMLGFMSGLIANTAIKETLTNFGIDFSDLSIEDLTKIIGALQTGEKEIINKTLDEYKQEIEK